MHDQIFLDGKVIAYGWVLLTASNQDGTVVAWSWTARESTAAYQHLLKDIAPPLVVTIDGASGARAAITTTWGPDSVKVQRCLLHVHRNNIRDLTTRPQTPAGKALLALSQILLGITTTQHAARWYANLAHFHQVYVHWLKERTFAKDDPHQAQQRHRTWWYTHERDRRVYQRLNALAKEGTLWTYLTAKPGHILERTTNIAESLNARIDANCYHHRGLSQPHLISAIEWYLHSRTEDPKSPQQILTDWHTQGQPPAAIIPKRIPPAPNIGPKRYDTAFNPEQGLHPRKGWAGRWKP